MRHTLVPLLAAALAPLAAAAGSGDRAPVAYAVVDGAEIPEPIAPSGDAARGAALAADAARAGCAACHAIPGLPAPTAEAPAPDLAGIGARAAPGRLRLAVVNLAILAPEIEGHAFYDVADLGATEDEAAVGTTRLTAQEIEDLVAFLSALRD